MTQGVTENEILLGSSCASSGPFAAIGDPILVGTRAYFDMINAGGGIDGRRIRLLHIDDGYNPEKSRAAFHQLTEIDRVFALVSLFGAPVVAATLDDIHQLGIPVVYFATGMGELYVEGAHTFAEGANCYPIQPIHITEGRIMAVRAKADFGARRIGVIYTSDATGTDLNTGATMQCARMGLSCVTARVIADSTYVSAAVSQMRAADVDFIIVASSQGSFPAIVQEMAAQGLRLPAMTTYVNTVITLAEQVVEPIRGKFDLYAPGWLNYEGEHAPNLELASEWLGDYVMNGYAHCGWCAGHFFCEGLRRLKGREVTWESFRKAMESAPVRIPFGGEVDYANGQRLGTQEMSLYRLDMRSATGWYEIDGLRSMEELLHRGEN